LDLVFKRFPIGNPVAAWRGSGRRENQGEFTIYDLRITISAEP
jgi:hypothetical protein